MKARDSMNQGEQGKSRSFTRFVERVGHKIPDPIIIFMSFYPIAFVTTVLMGGHQFETIGAGGEAISYQILPMHHAEHVRWIFDNALLQNWLAFGNGVLGVILVVMLAIGVAENSGLFAALIKRVGTHIPQRWLPLLLMFLGITSSVATDAGYLVLIPLAGLLYAGLGRNPLIGMAAAFAGVSAGFSANLIPGPVDAIIGLNAQIFAESQGVPFANAAGEALNPVTMHHWFIITSTGVLALTGFWVTRRFVEPMLEGGEFVIPDDIKPGDFELNDEERRGLRASLPGAIVAILMCLGLALGPLATFTDATGSEVSPWMNNIILLISLFFAVCGLFFGVAAGRFR